jgi:hypothetical protein
MTSEHTEQGGAPPVRNPNVDPNIDRERDEPEDQNTTEGDEDDGEQEASARKGGIFDRSRYNYGKNGVKTPTGRPSVDNGDPISVALRGKGADECVNLVRENGQEPGAWDALNPGMRRMNAANMLRRLAKMPDGVWIDGVQVKMAPKVEEQVAEEAA